MIEEASESLSGTPTLNEVAGGYDTEADDDKPAKKSDPQIGRAHV